MILTKIVNGCNLKEWKAKEVVTTNVKSKRDIELNISVIAKEEENDDNYVEIIDQYQQTTWSYLAVCREWQK